jgi:hypothetical protein
MKCYRCKREMSPWPLKRADVCAPAGWSSCIRWPNEKDRAHGATEAEMSATLLEGTMQIDLMRSLAYLDDCERQRRAAQ